MPPKTNTQKTVYFLGAGASAASDFKLPVMKGFFKEKDFPKKGGKYPNLSVFLQNFYTSKDWNNFNLEEIITHLELTMEGFSWDSVDSYLHDVKQELYKYIKYRIGDPVNNNACNNHKKLFQKLKPDFDTIISPNYDLIVDNTLSHFKYHIAKSDFKNAKIVQELINNNIIIDDPDDSNFAHFNDNIKDKNKLKSKLKRIGISKIDYIMEVWQQLHDREGSFVEFENYIYRSNTLFLWRTPPRKLKPVTLQGKEKGCYIKLHGSLNWIYCPNSDCVNNLYFWPTDHSGEPCYACGTNLETVIVPPTMKKSFEKFPKLGFLWHVAFNKLKEADRIIVIGMSFPDSDYYLKWLVRQAMMEKTKSPELVIVNPDTNKNDFIDKMKNVFGIPKNEKIGLSLKFENYVKDPNKLKFK
jgi:NAD-dependent SIR2 family protein deacetylase